MMLIKANKDSETGAMPDAAALAEMGKYNEELCKAGIMLTGDGLHASSAGFRLRNERGTISVVDGPFAETKELIAGFWMLDVKSREEAIEWARRVPLLSADTPQLELRQVMELDDFPVDENESGWREQELELRGGVPDGPLGATAKPDDGARRYRYMFIVKANVDSEAGALPNEQMLTDMGNLMAEMATSGVLIGGEGLAPSSKGARIHFKNGKRAVIDGPFAETKELIAGYCMTQVKSREEALEWASRMVKVQGHGELEVRRMIDAEDFSAETIAQVPEIFEAERQFRERAAH